jgi:hypothetical protein
MDLASGNVTARTERRDFPWHILARRSKYKDL